MTNFVKCPKGGVQGAQRFDCVGMYREADPTITGDMPRVQLKVRNVNTSFFDASVFSADSMDVPVCFECPARIADEIQRRAQAQAGVR